MKRRACGVLLDGDRARLACVTVEGKRSCHIDLVEEFILARPLSKAAINKTILKYQSRTGFCPVVTGLDFSKVLLRKLTLSQAKPRLLEKMLTFQLESQLPFPVDQAISSYYSSSKDKQTQVCISVCRKEDLLSHIEKHKQLIQADSIVSYASQGLHRFSEYFLSEPNMITLHMKREQTACVFIKENELACSKSFDAGIDEFIKAVKKDLKTQSDEEARSLLMQLELDEVVPGSFESLSKVIDSYVKRLDRLFYALSTNYQAGGETVLLSGEHQFLQKLIRLLPAFSQGRFSVCTSRKSNSVDEQKFAIEIGLALDALKEDKKSAQFRISKDLPKSFQKAFLKKAVVFALSGAFFCFSVFLASKIFLKSKESALESRVESFLSDYVDGVYHLQSDYAKIKDNVYAKLRFAKKNFGKSIPSGKFYDPPVAVSTIIQVISEFFSGYPSKTMAIESFDYSLENAPDIKTPSQSYGIKVVVAISGVDEKLVQSLSEALLKKSFIEKVQTRAGRKQDEVLVEFRVFEKI